MALQSTFPIFLPSTGRSTSSSHIPASNCCSNFLTFEASYTNLRLRKEFLANQDVSSRQKNFLTLSSKRSLSTIVTRSAAFLCVAFAGNPGNEGKGQSLSVDKKPISKKYRHYRKRRSPLKEKKDELGQSVTTDLRACISNASVPVFTEDSDELDTIALVEEGAELREDSGELIFHSPDNLSSRQLGTVE